MLKIFAIFALFLLPPLYAAQAKSVDVPNYRQAFADLDAGLYQKAFSIIGNGGNPVLNDVLRGYAMARPGNDYSFAALTGFVTDHSGWPGLSGILMIAEQKIPPDATAEQIVTWFNAHPPLTLVGFYRNAAALDHLGQTDKVTALVRTRWINNDFSNDEQTAFHARFEAVLTAQDHHARLDRLLWANNIAGARSMYVYVDASHRALAEARIALANSVNNPERFLGAVPESLRNDSGLLYERLRWRRKNNMDDGAVEILLHPPQNYGHPENWWAERSIIIRRVMDRKDYKLAYRLAAEHGLTEGFDYIQSEFQAGWLALRFLNRPELARDHFEALLEGASTPISRARGAYWLGRTLEVLGEKQDAEQSYENAAALSTTFYGQLAMARLYAHPVINTPPEPAIPENVKSKFMAREAISAIEQLYRINQIDRAHAFFKAATDASMQRAEYVFLMQLGYHLRRPDWAINAAKAANLKNMVVAGAFPVLTIHVPSPPDPAFTHALIRQESLFNADAGSPVGARGLMQLMPGTAKGVAKQLGIKYTPARITDPDYNLRLGTVYVQQQLDHFNGSYILALAGYNAGPGRVHEWLGQYGDPRTANVDPIDWIEEIPIYETRNYVQRIMENFQTYRARLNNGRAPMTLMQDLVR